VKVRILIIFAPTNINPNMEITKDNLEYLYHNVFSEARFLAVDPCAIVWELSAHTQRQLDLEIGGLFVAMITWGNRKAIRTAARHMLGDEMQWNPSAFILEQQYLDCYQNAKNNCVYRTLNKFKFIEVCENIYNALESCRTTHPSEELTLEKCLEGLDMKQCIATITEWLAPAKLGTMGKTACKRICMFLRWMVRTETPDFGLWKSHLPSELYAILDVHICELTFPILKHKQASWQACEELTEIFRKWDKDDPLKYDVALMTLADQITTGEEKIVR
jgi:uncharacterized protein (TIGR02757 family)